MKLNHLHLPWLTRNDGEHIATFGQARLVKHLNGQFQLQGGTAADHQAAREWCSLFLHEAAPACGAARKPPVENAPSPR